MGGFLDGIRNNISLPCALALVFLISCAGAGSQAGTPALQTSVGQASPPGDLTGALSELDSMPCPKGVSVQTWADLTGALGEALRAKAASALALRPPHGDAAASTLVYSAAGALLNWRYYSPGDYDQNGVVGLSDLVPLAVHFGESSGTGSPFPENSIGAVIDGDGNGELNLADIIAIALNFGVHVEGYRIYAADNTAAYPPSPDSSNGTGTVFIGVASMSLAVEPPGGGRKVFNYQVVPTATTRYFWVRPTDGETDGSASNYVVVVLPPKWGPVAKLANPPTAETLAHIVWNASTSFDPDGVISRYEWDFNADGVYEYDSGDVPTANFYYYAPGDYTCAVRVTDNDEMSATASGQATVTEKAKWRINVADERRQVLENDFTLARPLIVDAGGRPGLFYMRNTRYPEVPLVAEQSLVYRRALDEHGESWAVPVILATQAQPVDYITEVVALCSAAIVEGRPAVVFDRSIDDQTQPERTMTHIVYYLRADEELGMRWPQPHILNYAQYTYYAPQTPIVGTDFYVLALLVVGDRPALLGIGPGSEDYRWLRAQDGIGSSWAEPRVVGEYSTYLGGTLGDSVIVAVIEGLPARARSSGDDLLYSHAVDPDQPEWLPPEVLVDEHEKASSHIQLVEAAGCPAVVYYDSATNDLKFRRALDPQGSMWAAPVVLTPRATSGGFLAVVVDGRPCVLYGDRIDKTARFIAANDAAGTYWGFPMAIWEAPDPGSISDLSQIPPLVEVAGTPAFCLLNHVSDETRWGKDQILYESYY